MAVGHLGLLGGKSRSTALAWSMVLAPASLSSLTNRSWKVPAIRSTRPLAWGERAKTCSMPNSPMALVNWVGPTGWVKCRGLPLNLKTPWRSP